MLKNQSPRADKSMIVKSMQKLISTNSSIQTLTLVVVPLFTRAIIRKTDPYNCCPASINEGAYSTFRHVFKLLFDTETDLKKPKSPFLSEKLKKENRQSDTCAVELSIFSVLKNVFLNFLNAYPRFLFQIYIFIFSSIDRNGIISYKLFWGCLH